MSQVSTPSPELEPLFLRGSATPGNFLRFADPTGRVLEDSGVSEDDLGGGPGESLPPGSMIQYAGSSAPAGWLLCDGAAVSRATYADLFAVIGEDYGAGNGTTTFNVPDMGARTAVGYKTGDPDFGTLAQAVGAKTVASTGSVAAPTFTGAAWTPPAISWPAGVPTAANESTHTHSVTSNVAVGNHSFTQPTISWPAGVPTAANESAHTHTYTQVVDHVHTLATGTGATGNFSQVVGTVDTSSGGTGGTPTQTALATRSGNPVGSAGATGTTAGGSAHTHTISWPAGVPTNASGAVDAHSVTNNAVTSAAGSAHTHTISWPGDVPTVGAYTPAGTNNAPAYTGNATSVLQPSLTLNWLIKT